MAPMFAFKLNNVLRPMSRRPLWKKQIPKYPLYWKGDPQLRVLLPQFWLRIVKPKRKVPPNIVHFEVHPQMSKLDIQQYLQKIYKVPVVRVNTEIREGRYIYDRSGTLDDPKKEEEGYKAIWKDDDKKFAYVTLEDGHTFTYPDLFKDGKPGDKETSEFEKSTKEIEQREVEQWDKQSIPPWFR